MAKSIKLADNTYIDASGVTVDSSGKTLTTALSERLRCVRKYLNNVHTISVDMSALGMASSPRKFLLTLAQWQGTWARIIEGYVRYSDQAAENVAVVLIDSASQIQGITATIENGILTFTWSNNASYVTLLVFDTV